MRYVFPAERRPADGPVPLRIVGRAERFFLVRGGDFGGCRKLNLQKYPLFFVKTASKFIFLTAPAFHVIILELTRNCQHLIREKIMTKKWMIAATVSFLLATSQLFAFGSYKEAFDQAGKQENAKKYAEAGNDYAEAFKLAKTASEKFDSLFRQGECLRLERKYDEGLEVFKKAGVLEGITPSQKGIAQLRVAQCNEWSQKWDPAIVEYEAILVIDKVSPDQQANAYLGAASCYRAKKQYDKSEQSMDKLLALKNISPYYVARAYMIKGYNDRETKKLDDAIANLNKAIEVPKAHPHLISESRNAIADILMSQKKYDEAEKMSQSVVNDSAAHPYHIASAMNRIATIQRNNKKYDDSIKTSEAVIALKDMHPNYMTDAQLNIGYCYFYKKEYAKAMDQFKLVMDSKTAAVWHKNSAKSWSVNTQKELDKTKK